MIASTSSSWAPAFLASQPPSAPGDAGAQPHATAYTPHAHTPRDPHTPRTHTQLRRRMRGKQTLTARHTQQRHNMQDETLAEPGPLSLAGKQCASCCCDYVARPTDACTACARAFQIMPTRAVLSAELLLRLLNAVIRTEVARSI